MVLECGSRSTFIIATHQSRTDLAEIKSEIKAASPPNPHSTLHKTQKVHITHYAVHYALRNVLLTQHPTADWAEFHFTLHTSHSSLLILPGYLTTQYTRETMEPHHGLWPGIAIIAHKANSGRVVARAALLGRARLQHRPGQAAPQQQPKQNLFRIISVQE